MLRNIDQQKSKDGNVEKNNSYAIVPHTGSGEEKKKGRRFAVALNSSFSSIGCFEERWSATAVLVIIMKEMTRDAI